MTDLTHPAAVMNRLAEIENDLANRQGAYEAAATAWFKAKRDKEHKRAVAFIEATGTVAERSAVADRDTSMVGAEDEALWEALKAVVKIMEARAMIGMALLKTHGRA